MARRHSRTWREVLVNTPTRRHRGTIKRFYQQWRVENEIPPRCDIPECQFHDGNLVWIRDSLPLILDHIEGTLFDNRPEKLRYLCPNCDSQLQTKGGKNIGRVMEEVGCGFILIDYDGTKHHSFFPTGGIKVGGSVKVGVHYHKTMSDCISIGG